MITPRPSSPGAKIHHGPMTPFFGIDPVLMSDTVRLRIVFLNLVFSDSHQRNLVLRKHFQKLILMIKHVLDFIG